MFSIFLFQPADANASIISSISFLFIMIALIEFYRIQKNDLKLLGAIGLCIAISGLLIAITGFMVPPLRHYSPDIWMMISVETNRKLLAIGWLGYVIIIPIGMVVIGIASLKSKLLPAWGKVLPLLYGALYLTGYIFNVHNMILGSVYTVAWIGMGFLILKMSTEPKGTVL